MIVHMAEVGLIRTVLTGFTGAPGYNTLAFFGDPYSNSTAQDNVDDVYAFWNGVVTAMPAGAHFAIDPDVKVVNEATGALIRLETTTPSAQTGVGVSGSYSAGVGCCATIVTPAVHLTKQLKGRIFMTPLAGAAYDSTGTIDGTYLTALRGLATTLGAVANFGVWGRPVAGSGGEWSGATGVSIRDHVAWLSSRRD